MWVFDLVRRVWIRVDEACLRMSDLEIDCVYYMSFSFFFFERFVLRVFLDDFLFVF